LHELQKDSDREVQWEGGRVADRLAKDYPAASLHAPRAVERIAMNEAQANLLKTSNPKLAGIGETIRTLRIRKKITQKEFASRMGVADGTMWRLENWSMTWDVRMLMKASDILEIKAWKILRHVEMPSNLEGDAK
jgi:DNA-binding XRE family transcriptional regulator